MHHPPPGSVVKGGLQSGIADHVWTIAELLI
jgi:hypothetical protein